MFNLIRKDLFCQKNLIKSSLFIIFVVMFFANKLRVEGIYMLLTVGTVYSLSAIDEIDNRSYFKYVINSLPVTRKQIVISKYIRTIILTIVILAVLTGLSYILPFRIKPLGISGAIYILETVIVFYSIDYMFYFSLKPKISQIIKILLFVCVWGFGFSIFDIESSSDYMKFMNIINTFNSNKFIAAFAMIIIFLTSIFISIKIYENKDI